jgi:peptidoglycan/xylan/chitin deacetylase (PgdA/CDA1 family)
VNHVLGSVRNGSIVVMHITDGDTAPLTARALPPIVEGLRARGYELVQVSTLLSTTGSPTIGSPTTGSPGNGALP